eukprot:g19491.t1
MLSRPYAPGLSYVGRKDLWSFCFTGHYGKVMHKSSGSLLYLADEPVDRSALPKSVGLEILNFLGFPESYKLPRDMELKHRYKVVGNSIAVSVASELLRLLLRGEGAERIKALEEMPHRPNQAQQASVTSPQEPSSASGSRPPQKLSGRSSSSSTSAGNGSVASSPTVSSSSSEWLGFAGLFQPRPYPRPQSGNSSLKKALGQRGGVVKERDGFEVFFGVEKSKEKKKLRKSLDSRDGFDKFYGIPSAGAEEDSSTSPTRRMSALLHTGEAFELPDWQVEETFMQYDLARQQELATSEEETTSDDFFWNKAMMQAALLEGILFSSEVGDTERVQSYSNALQALGNTLETHKEWSLMGSFITECPPGSAHNSCAEYRKRIDGAVILGLVHGRTRIACAGVHCSVKRRDLWSTVMQRLQRNTIRAYNKEFCSLYALNQEESGNGRPGILYGRYAADKYGGEDGGNPWVLITAALANLLYQAASQVSHTALNLED